MMVAAKWQDYANDLPADLVKGALAISGVFDLAPLLSVSFNSEMRLDEAAVRKVSPIYYYPARAVPLHTAVGELESDEFKRQSRLIGETWPHCRGDYMEVPGCHHLSVVEALADPRHALFQRALRMAEDS
jgi:arylformamidase